MHGDGLLFADLALVLCVAALTSVLFKKLRQPVVLGYLLAGLLVGPHTSFPFFADLERVQALSELGVILVMFSIGLEFSLRKLVVVFPRAGLVGLIQIGAMLWLGYATGKLLGWTTLESLFTGAIVSVSSTMIIAKVFAERPVEKRLSDLVLGVLILEDIAAILMLAILTAVASGEGQAGTVLLETTAKLGAFLLALTVGGYLVVPRVIRAVARLASPETLLVTSVGLCFAFSLMAEKAGYSVALGAFVAGAVVAESGRGKSIERLVFPLRDLFAAVFFVAVGMLVDPAVIAERWVAVVALVIVVVVGKTASVTLGAILSGVDFPTALRAGMVLPQIGEFSFILAGVGVATQAIDPGLYGIAVTVSVVTSFLTPWLARSSGKLALSIEHGLPGPLRTFGSLYASWLEDLRARRRAGAQLKVRRLLGWLALDVLCVAGVVIAASLGLERAVEFLVARTGLSPGFARAASLVAAGLVALPFLLGIVRVSRTLAAVLAAAVLPVKESGGVDLAAAPRRAFVVALQLAVVVLVGGPLLALTQPFVPVLVHALLVLVGLVALAVVFWRRAEDLEAHVRAGAQVVLEVLQRQVEDEEPTLEAAAPLLPGLGDVTPFRLEPDSPAVGQTLASIDLRARTGASVIAISREGKGIVAPTGRETLRATDVLALAGSSEAIEEAKDLLTSGLPGTFRDEKERSVSAE